jgi:hypothetical protein
MREFLITALCEKKNTGLKVGGLKGHERAEHSQLIRNDKNWHIPYYLDLLPLP